LFLKTCLRSGAAACAVTLVFAAGGAGAQSVDDNAVKQAEDAFGTRVGQEAVGLYSATSARGFNPQDAGNMRLEGLYFDQRTQFLCGRIQKSTTMRVGLPAQDFAFPAPTGIVDISISQPTPKWTPALAVQYLKPHGLNFIAGALQGPVTDTVGVYFGISYVENTGSHNGSWVMNCGALVGRWTPNDKLQVMPLYTWNDRRNDESPPQILMAGALTPPRFNRRMFYGQSWAERHAFEETYGAIVRAAPLETWTINAGLFNSVSERVPSATVLFRNTNAAGIGTLDITGFPEHYAASVSGEVRATGVFTQGKVWQHTINLSVRGRDTDRKFGGGQTVGFGPRRVGVNDPVFEPAYVYGVRDIDHVRQITPGAAYTGRWAGTGALSVGVQKSLYRRDLSKEKGAATRTKSEPWLYYSTVAFYATNEITLFGSYMRGLEEFGVAPDNAANRGEPMRASLTEQIDAGVHYRIKPGLSASASVFEISKPYFDRDTTNVFTNVGALKHQGVELSLTGRLSPTWTVVTGALFLKPRVSGLPVDQGRLAEVPAGTPWQNINLNTQFSPPSWKGAALDATVEVTGRYYADRLNTLRMPSYATLNIGARYPLNIAGGRAVLRLLVNNITNTFAWTVNGASGAFAPISPTTYMVRLLADF